jgi:anti-sigma factor RsiW
MSVSHPQQNLIAYLRGELMADERALITAHLIDCSRCQAEAAALSAGMKMIAQAVETLPAPDWREYRAELRRKLIARQERASLWRRVRLVYGSLATAGCAAVILLSLTLLGHGRRQATPVSPMMDQLAMADVMSRTDVELLRDYPVVERLDMLENYDVIEHLDEVSPATSETHATHQL